MSKRVFIAGHPDDDDFDAASGRLKEAGYVTANVPSDNLRWMLSTLSTCHVVCLLPSWWTDENAHAISIAAGWLRMDSVDHETGEVIEKRRVRRA